MECVSAPLVPGALSFLTVSSPVTCCRAWSVNQRVCRSSLASIGSGVRCVALPGLPQRSCRSTAYWPRQKDRTDTMSGQ